jgi:hypothetical protein
MKPSGSEDSVVGSSNTPLIKLSRATSLALKLHKTKSKRFKDIQKRNSSNIDGIDNSNSNSNNDNNESASGISRNITTEDVSEDVGDNKIANNKMLKQSLSVLSDGNVFGEESGSGLVDGHGRGLGDIGGSSSDREIDGEEVDDNDIYEKEIELAEKEVSKYYYYILLCTLLYTIINI